MITDIRVFRSGITAGLGFISTVFLATAVSAAPITSNWTPGNAGNWSGGAADAVNWNHSQPPTPPSTQTFPNNNGFDTYSVDIGGSSSSVVDLNTNVTIDSLQVGATNTLNLNNGANLNFVSGATVSNNGNINLNSAGLLTAINFGGNGTITGSGTITLGNNPNNRIHQTVGGGIITHTAGHIIRGSGNVLAGTGGMDNAGTIIADQANALTIDPGIDPFNNIGTLRAQSGATLRLQSGTFNNAGGSIEADGPGSNVELASPSTVINGGNLTTTNGGEFRADINGGPQLNGVTLTTGSTFVQGNGGDATIFGGLTNNGTWNLNAVNSQTAIQFSGTQTLTGTGEIVMGNSINNAILVSTNADILTLDTAQTIRGAGDILQGSGGFINNGTILQQGTVALTIDPGTTDVDGNGNNFVNNGTLRSEGTGGLTLNGASYQNAGQTIESVGGGDIRLNSTLTTIRGGTVAISGGGVLRSTSNGGAILDGVTIASGTNVVQAGAEDFRIQNGLTNNGNWALNSTGAQVVLQFLGSQTLEGSGEVVLGNNINNDILVATNANVLTQAAGHTIRGAGDILQGTGGFINQGSILADEATRLRIDAGTNFSQQGLLQASGSGGIELDGGAAFTQAAGLTDIQSGSQITVTSGNYVQTGGETRVNGTFATIGVNGGVDLQGGRFSGTGLVDFDGLGVHVLNNTGGTLAAGNSPGVLTIQDGDYVQGAGGTFEFELNGFTAGVEHDLLTIVNGDADLGGDLNIIADQLFASTLNIGDQFEVVRLDSSGVFLDGDLDLSADVFDTLTINLGGLNFTQFFGSNTIGGTSLFLQVVQADVLPPGVDPVPEPAPLLVMLFGVAGLAYARRRRAA